MVTVSKSRRSGFEINFLLVNHQSWELDIAVEGIGNWMPLHVLNLAQTSVEKGQSTNRCLQLSPG